MDVTKDVEGYPSQSSKGYTRDSVNIKTCQVSYHGYVYSWYCNCALVYLGSTWGSGYEAACVSRAPLGHEHITINPVLLTRVGVQVTTLQSLPRGRCDRFINRSD